MAIAAAVKNHLENRRITFPPWSSRRLLERKSLWSSLGGISSSISEPYEAESG
jgi:hypothetical protein